MTHQPPSPSRQRSLRSPPRSRVDEPNRDLLAKRLTTVSELQREMLDRWNKKSTGPVSKAIPVPLHAGETLQQYTRAFESWLLTKNETFASLRYDICRERGFWFSFAHKRAGACGNKASLQRDMDGLSSFYGPQSGNSNKRTRYSESSSYDREKSFAQRSEWSYSSSTREWGYETRTNPTRSRDNELHQVTKEGKHSSRHESVRSCQTTSEKAVEKRSDELLAHRMVSPEQFLNVLASGKNTLISLLKSENSMPAKSSTRQDDVQHRHGDQTSPNTSCTKFVTEIDTIEARKSDDINSFLPKVQFGTNSSLKSPAHRSLDGKYEKFEPAPLISSADRSEKINNADTTRTEQSSEFQAYFDSPPAWAAQLIKQVQDLQNMVDQLQHEIKTLRGSHKAEQSCLSTEKPENMDTDNSVAIESSVDSRLSSSPRTRSVDVKNEVIMDEELTTETKDSTAIEILQRMLFPRADDTCFSVKDDPEKRRLIAEYDYINTQIIANQTAIDDALEYVKTIKDVDEASAAEHHSQIMELVVSVNQEKKKRASALSALIVYSWSGRREALLSILAEDAIVSQNGSVKHEKWEALSSRIKENDAELKQLETQVNDQVQAVRASFMESDSARHLILLRGLSDKLTTERTALEGEQQQLLATFLRCDEEIQKMAKKLLEKSKRP
ncbi:hypothetical protein L916_15079 [Phytophthora nicotianae]|uniref:Uncharacterized protein n=1 Tax=Phytophthora nicotianae TaxID=4792 RepID=W2IDR9_PHYNI|nr:hypothetical protein L916_15079 [Phytophthora nicotianae]